LLSEICGCLSDCNFLTQLVAHWAHAVASALYVCLQAYYTQQVEWFVQMVSPPGAPNFSNPRCRQLRSQLGPPASLHHGPVEWPASRGWQGQIQCHCRDGLSSECEDDQDDVSSPHQVNDRMPG